MPDLTQEPDWFRVTLASIGDAVITTDLEGKVTYLNPTAEALTGWPLSEATGRNLETIFRIINEETRRPAPNPVSRVLREGVVVGLANHTLLIARDGTESAIDDSAAPIRSGGKMSGVVLVFHDISEKRKIEVALVEAERRFRLMVDAVKDYAIFMLDPLGTIMSWNAGAERIKGYRPEEIIGSHFSRFYSSEDIQAGKPETELKIAIKEGRYEEEGWRIRKDGTRFWASVIITPVRDEAGKLLGFSKVTRDLSARRMMEEQLRQSEERFRLLIDGVRDYSIFAVNNDGKIISWNSGAERISGYKGGEVIGKSMSLFYTTDEARSGKAERELAIASQMGRFEEEGIRVRKDGSQYWANVIITALHDFSGRPAGFAKVTRDITERRHTQLALQNSKAELEVKVRERTAELENANRMKDEFLATVSHELRTPLTPMLGWTRMLQSGKLDEQGRNRGIQIIEKNVQLQIRIIEDLLDISRIISGKLKLEMRPTSIARIIESSIEIVRSAAEVKSIQIEFLMKNSVSVSGDSSRLQQVFWNILSNAIKFTPAKGKITVELGSDDHHALITITDTGEGMTADFIPYIFDRFSQSDSSTKRRHGGLGIGLAIVKQIVELHGGSVSAASEGAGKGATISVRLPLSRQQASTQHQYPYGNVEQDKRVLAGIKAVIVDDEDDSRDFLELLLQQFGAAVRTANSVRTALVEIDDFKPDILISDIGMPEMDGYDLIRAVRQRGKPLPAIALTAYARAEDHTRALAEGFQAHLPKPVDPAELISVISQISTVV